MNYEREIAAMRRISKASSALAMRYFEQGIQMEDKSDDSPVTIADKESEKLIASMLEDLFPEDGQRGEEGVAKPSRSGRTWIIDPIDGTRDFVRGNMLWGVLLGLEENGKPVAGCAHYPVMNETYFASVGGGAWCNDVRCKVSAVERLDRAVVCFNGLQNNKKWSYRDQVLDFCANFWAVRSLSGGPDCMMIVTGKAEVWVEPSAQPWDLCPLKVLVEEAGGKFFNFAGTDSIYGGNALICTPSFEAMLREAFVK